MQESTHRWDPGLQPERTALAWRRTVLSLTSGLVIAGRTLARDSSELGVALPCVGLAGGVVVLVLAARRTRQLAAYLRLPASSSPPSARALIAVTCGTFTLSIVGLWWTLTIALGG